MCLDVHPLSQIESVGVESLHAGQESYMITIFRARIFHDPVEQLPAVAFRARIVLRNQVVDIKILPAVKPLAYSNARDRFDLAPVRQINETVIKTVHLSPNAREEILA